MSDAERRPELLTYDTATAEQVAHARSEARRKLAEARARHTPEYWAELRERLNLPARSECDMRTVIGVDDELLAAAQSELGTSTDKDTVNEALRFVAERKAPITRNP